MSEYVLTLNDKKFGIPEQKKFPMPDADHVRSAIKFFNYVTPRYEKQLARAILRRAKEYGVDISEMSIGDTNRFKKYLPNELKHHGILGQKWGIRRYQNADGTLTEAGKKHYKVSEDYDGRIIPKNAKFYRITNNKNDVTYGGQKYLSTNKKDHKTWQKYIGDAYAKRGYETYNVKYKSVKDLKIAKSTKLGELFLDIQMKNPEISNQIIKDTKSAQNNMNYRSDDMMDLLSLNFVLQTESGKRFINQLLDLGYDGIEDAHGQNTSKDPIIVFNPEQNLKKKNASRYK